MAHPFVDTDVIIRLLTGDDLAKQQAARKLFEQVEQGTLTLAAPDTVIADAVFVLSSKRLYNKSRGDVRDLLTPLVKLPHFRVQNKRAVLRALALYAQTTLDYSDVFIVATMEQANASRLYSYDEKLGKTPGITRQEP
ncbi:MAG: PIN domain-containing protein [Chloroflexota bacterium]|nr:PIN domain-containing protein [Chloroflexota bacterium]